MTTQEMRARKKLIQITAELTEKQPVNWHNVAHLSRDLCAVAVAVNAEPKLNERVEQVHRRV
jgi:hypothetical protein